MPGRFSSAAMITASGTLSSDMAVNTSVLIEDWNSSASLRTFW